MKILAIETSGKYASVCLFDEEKGITEKKSENEMSHLETLLPMSEELLSDCKLTINDIEAIAVSVGPGSFTGMRIGAAFARAISQAKNIKCISVNTLESFQFSSNPQIDKADLIIPMSDARRGQIYSAIYFGKSDFPKAEELATDVYMIDEYLEKVFEIVQEKFITAKCTVFFTGDASVKYREKIENWAEELRQSKFADVSVIFEEENLIHQSAYGIAKRAYFDYISGKFTSFEEIKPMYLRKAEAERKLEPEKMYMLDKATDKISI